MTFLHLNLLLAGLAAIALPILIHILLRRRRQPVYWGAMRFLMEAYQQQRRRVQLEQWLILACRCLMVALIAMAIARPFWSGGAATENRSARTLYVILDDTLTSATTDESGQSDYARMQSAAAEILKTVDAARGDRVALITLAGPAEARVTPPSSDAAAVLRLIAGHEPTAAAAADWNGAFALVADGLERERGASEASEAAATPLLAIFTGGRAGSIDPRQMAAKFAGVPANLRVVMAEPSKNVAANTAIVDVDPLRGVLTAAGDPGEVRSIGLVKVMLRRFGALPAAAGKLKLGIEGEEAARTGEQGIDHQFAWTPGQAEQTLIVNGPRITAAQTAGFPVLTASIDRDAIAGDNVFRAPLVARDVLRAALVAPRGQSKLLAGEGGSADQFSPGDWLWIGLDPAASAASLTERGGDLQRSWIDPAALSTAILSEFDVLVLAAPDEVSRDGWKRVRQAVDNGAALMVFPSPGTATQTWSDEFVAALALDVRISRESRELSPPLSLLWNEGQRPAWDPLQAIAPEAEELFKAVRVSRMLDFTDAAGRPLRGAAVLAGEGNVPVIVSRTPQDDRPSRGMVYIAAAAMTPEWTDLPARPLFVPMLQEMLRSGVARAAQDAKQIAGRPIRVPAGAATLRGPGSDVIAVEPGSGFAVPRRTSAAWTASDARGAVVAAVTVNADTAASDVAISSREQVAAAFKGMIAAESQMFIAGDTDVWVDTGTAGGARPADPPARLSLWLFGLAALLAIVELILGRFFSHAQPSRVKSVLAMNQQNAAAAA